MASEGVLVYRKASFRGWLSWPNEDFAGNGSLQYDSTQDTNPESPYHGEPAITGCSQLTTDHRIGFPYEACQHSVQDICQSYNLHVLVLLIGQGNSPCWHTSSGGYGPGQEAGSRRGPEVSRDVTRWPQDELRLAASVTALYYETQEDVTNLMEFVPDQKTLHTD